MTAAMRRPRAETETCPECGLPCRPVECDAGAGHFEFQGVTGRDVQPYVGSHCCGAALTDFNDVGPPVREWLDDY